MTRFSQAASGPSILVPGYSGGDFLAPRLIAQEGEEGVNERAVKNSGKARTGRLAVKKGSNLPFTLFGSK